MKTHLNMRLTAALIFLALSAMSGRALAQGPGACSQTAKAARRACSHEMKDDFWIAVGTCSNLESAAAQEGCLLGASYEKQEAREECGDQFEARIEVCGMLGEDPYDPAVDPAEFVDAAAMAAAPNPYFPLIPGTVLVYEGGGETITVTVTGETKEILGVQCVVVNDVVEEDGEVIEDTDDWYAQDVYGNVWYLGEIARNYEEGELVDLEGSWKAGRDGARPGIIMAALPAVGDLYRQEFLLGDAEDLAQVLSLTGTAAVPAPGASCDGDCLVTGDFTPIEPDHYEKKYYSPGIGLVLEVNPASGETVELVEILVP